MRRREGGGWREEGRGGERREEEGRGGKESVFEGFRDVVLHICNLGG
jgi:hypothetical protein